MRQLLGSSALLLLVSLPLSPASGAVPNAPTPAPTRAHGALPDTVVSPKFTGDFDGMLRRRRIRILVPFSKTLYFIDKGQQRGLAYDAFTLFADEINKRKKKGDVLFHAVFVPISRGDVIEALNEGRGDVAMAYLTITPERQKLVDFSNPTASNISEIVVTAPGEPPVASVQDLSGREVYIRKDSSYYRSVETLNQQLQKAGKPPV